MAPANVGRKAWAMTKLWMTVRDVPEVGVLAFLGASVVSMGLYTLSREYTSPAVDSYPSPEIRKDFWKQVAYGEAFKGKPSLFYRVAQFKVDDMGYNIGIFDNRMRPFEYNLPTSTAAHSSPQFETPDLMQQAII